MALYTKLREEMQRHGPRNRAYIEQVAREEAGAVQTWNSLRYGSVN
jgi:hypothetical protein